jgi:two-component system, chemotaxis family, protein-glutamate methylesterase/glutaminase
MRPLREPTRSLSTDRHAASFIRVASSRRDPGRLVVRRGHAGAYLDPKTGPAGAQLGQRDIIVIGGSAGSVEAGRSLVRGLPRDLAAAVFFVLHVPPYRPSGLPAILSAVGPLEAHHACDGESIRSGRIYVAPPDHHMMIESGRVLVRRGPKENRSRPAIDALFRSAAYGYGPRVIGVLLSGMLDDGVSGLWSIKRLGGLTMVQSPEDAQHPDMPRNALAQVQIDVVSPAAELGLLLARAAGQPVPEPCDLDATELERLGVEVDIAAQAGAFDKGVADWGDIAPFTCPDCHGALVRLEEGTMLRFRCRTGHAFTPSSLLAGITDAVEATLWQSMRALDEQTLILEHMAKHFRSAGHEKTAERFARRAETSKERAQLVHDSLPRHDELDIAIGAALR